MVPTVSWARVVPGFSHRELSISPEPAPSLDLISTDPVPNPPRTSFPGSLTIRAAVYRSRELFVSLASGVLLRSPGLLHELRFPFRFR